MSMQIKPSESPSQSTPSFMPVRTNLLQRKCACGGTPVRRRVRRVPQEAPAAPFYNQAETATAPPNVHEVLRSPGQPLDPATRAFMEPRFGHDFSQVRVHADTRATESARAVNALAYTVGRHIVLGQGQSALGTGERARLLAHELTRVIQQRNERLSNTEEVSLLDSEYHELEATRMADTIQTTVIAPNVSFARVDNAELSLQRSEDGREQSRQSKPRNAPRGTRPIDEWGFNKDDVHKIKDGIARGSGLGRHYS